MAKAKAPEGKTVEDRFGKVAEKAGQMADDIACTISEYIAGCEAIIEHFNTMIEAAKEDLARGGDDPAVEEDDDDEDEEEGDEEKES